jgi:putative membrane protein
MQNMDPAPGMSRSLFCYYPFMAMHPIVRFLVFWGVNTLSLWVADELFDGVSFLTPQSLLVAGLMLGIVNTFLKPLLVVLTLPLSVLTLGVFVLVINALMLLLVAWLVPGFTVAGFWSGFLVAIFVAVFSFIVNSLIGFNKVRIRRIR